MTDSERNSWFEQNTIFIVFYEKITIIDLSSTENFIQKKMARIQRDEIKNFKTVTRHTVLREHQLELQDSWINPFGGVTYQEDYIQSSATTIDSYDLYTFYEHLFYADDSIQVIKRIRYNFWMALGDIGGFYDGLRLVLALFMAPIAAIFFENDLLKDSIYAQSLT